MRFDYTKAGSGLTYEIRNIVEIANRLIRYGVEVNWENIGDPVAKGEALPKWFKETVKGVLDSNKAYEYSPTKGVCATREYIAAKNNALGGAQITKEDIIFFNGLGDAVSHTYAAMHVDARVLMPEPTYSTHFMAEVLHASFPPNTYHLDPTKDWLPDLAEMERKAQQHKSIISILVINPDNPTGYVYPKKMLEEVIRVARENELFVIFDEIYNQVVYDGVETCMLSQVIGDLPGISMKSISKDVPWPGGRCGWIEIYNAGKDPMFDRFISAIYRQKMAEVCSGTFPQIALPLIYEHPEYKGYLRERLNHYQKLAMIAVEELSKSKYLDVIAPRGAFYLSAVFKEGALNGRQKLPIKIAAIQDYIESVLSDKDPYDKRFTYYLLASTGICVVPLTSFFTTINGFRLVLLEKDVDRFAATVRRIAEHVDIYVESALES
jgi:aspartate/methionine/tyrosine aminotransferase